MDPYQDKDISSKRTKCLKRDFPKNVDGQVDSIEYAKFLTTTETFADSDSFCDQGRMEPKYW